MAAVGGRRCKYPGCTRPTFYDRVTGEEHDFCGRTHAREYALLLYSAPSPASKKVHTASAAAAAPRTTTYAAAAAGAGSASASSGAIGGFYSSSTTAAGKKQQHSGGGGGGGGGTAIGGFGGTSSSSPPVAATAAATAALSVAVTTTPEVAAAVMPSDPQRPILFYNAGEPFYEFTNFAAAPITVDGVTWPTTEHFFQASKFIGETPKLAQVFAALPSARDAFNLSRTLEPLKRADWESAKEQVMRTALEHKFRDHPALARLLMQTHPHPLVEHSPVDAFWGDGGAVGRGRNRLGELLVELRERMVAESRQLQQLQQQHDLLMQHQQQQQYQQMQQQYQLQQLQQRDFQLQAQIQQQHQQQPQLMQHDQHHDQQPPQSQQLQSQQQPPQSQQPQSQQQPPHSLQLPQMQQPPQSPQPPQMQADPHQLHDTIQKAQLQIEKLQQALQSLDGVSQLQQFRDAIMHELQQQRDIIQQAQRALAQQQQQPALTQQQQSVLAQQHPPPSYLDVVTASPATQPHSPPISCSLSPEIPASAAGPVYH